MNAYQYRVPVGTNVSSYFKTFPLSVWSHKHFIENTDILDFEQATRLWYENLTTIRNLPGSLLSKELFDVIIKRKMGDTLTINKKKRKYAEDEVHTSSVTTSAKLLKDTFKYHENNTRQKLGVPVTPSPPSVTFVTNQDNEEAHTDPEKVITNQDSEDSSTAPEKVITNQDSEDSSTAPEKVITNQDNEMASTAPEKTKTFNNEHIDSASERSSEELEDENNEELKFDLDISLSFQCEATVKWEVGNINITDRFREYQKDVLKKAERGLCYENTYELLALSSIIVICWPCPYHIFTNQEWAEIIKTNPYTIETPSLPQEISASLHEASCENFISEEVFMNGGRRH
ncbi:hypothetical protein C2G38_106317 [Gigaspora rosea]|uniref:Uncharacterized protein n=1 Tax=Gigaspora rosea TaxID=44941 RepID=A0A397UVB9_9GLOM|nr:hypothetical protein C2G38_106317 [Gigaspora rosea]